MVLAFLLTISLYLTIRAWLESGYLGKGSKNFMNEKQTICVLPELQLWHPDIKPFFMNPSPLECSSVEENWIYTTNGSYHISEAALQKHRDVLCEYTPLHRGKDDFEVKRGTSKKGSAVKVKLETDMFLARCVGSDGGTYSNVHSSIAYKEELHKKPHRKPQQMNVLMFGLDSTSRLTWIRNLPRTHDYVTSQLGAVVMEGYNIVGDGTPQALLPILTGHNEMELPEARKGFDNASFVDGHPWIWKELKDNGYVTQWGEDGAAFGTFTYRMLGFKEQPVDHYMRTFYLSAEDMYYRNKPYCMGSVPRHVNMLNWIREFYRMYPDQPKFSFLFHSELSHDVHSMSRLIDQDLKDLIWDLDQEGHLDNTLLILMADHGARFQSMRQTEQGKFEERLPYLSLRFPPKFLRSHPDVAANLQKNSKRLSTPYDLHATFQQLLNFNRSQTDPRAKSFMTEIPKSRTCAEAGVEPHWCSCLQWQRISSSDYIIHKTAAELVKAINSFSSKHRHMCAELRLHNITSAARFIATEDVLRFKKSLDEDGRLADLSDDMSVSDVLYQIAIGTEPNQATYEGIVTHHTHSNTFTVSYRQISRTNRYGDQPHCVQKKHPHLRPFCFCTKQM
ncbi:hypothetical protein CAPTEDRAFT_140198 [Capitella teleta]|uniref:Sulfatase N-terminal domain-containing protein n=1 Tax=Capitella teleta TaxID=283909 RepID=R7TH42_CAPTE|nr:hypothetical protein CAPTEDRAFT_140198 [Capitella teleta]|eukprot:ELT92777.1 hypothetical protein CAPTEDRAFT_140198 [Capitella teleta]